jgi:hypothetical protein
MPLVPLSGSDKSSPHFVIQTAVAGSCDQLLNSLFVQSTRCVYSAVCFENEQPCNQRHFRSTIGSPSVIIIIIIIAAAAEISIRM